jgi:hypothetical protein
MGSLTGFCVALRGASVTGRSEGAITARLMGFVIETWFRI